MLFTASWIDIHNQNGIGLYIYNFVENTKFDKLGVFEYSKEEGTPAEKLPNQIHHNTKKARRNKIMKIQQEISNEKMKNMVGQIVEVLVEDISFDEKCFIGRTRRDVPDIDGLVYIRNNKSISLDKIINTFQKCKVIDYSEYDLIAELIK